MTKYKISDWTRNFVIEWLPIAVQNFFDDLSCITDDLPEGYTADDFSRLVADKLVKFKHVAEEVGMGFKLLVDNVSSGNERDAVDKHVRKSGLTVYGETKSVLP